MIDELHVYRHVLRIISDRWAAGNPEEPSISHMTTLVMDLIEEKGIPEAVQAILEEDGDNAKELGQTLGKVPVINLLQCIPQ